LSQGCRISSIDMSPHPTRRAEPRAAQWEGATPLTPINRSARTERHRRAQHFRRRRRDLLEDLAMAVVLAAIVIIATAGLGVVAIIDIGVAVGLVGTLLAEREFRKRRGRRQAPRHRMAATHPR
jgi:hypothetical protein